MRQLADKIAAFRHPRSTILEPINRAEHRCAGGVERAHQRMSGGPLALAHWPSPKLGTGLFGAHFLDRIGPFGNLGGPSRKMGTSKWAFFFLGFAAFLGSKNMAT